MSSLKFILPVLAATATVFAQSNDDCSNEGTTTLTAAAQATGLASCTTYSGSIALATGVAGDFALSGIEELTGDLIAENNNALSSITANDLQSIGGEFRLKADTALMRLSFPQLTKVKALNWVSLASLSQIGFDKELSEASDITISDTQLNSLKGINIEMIDTMYISQNSYLKEITIKATNVTEALTIQDNSADTAASFPNLENARNISLTGCKSVDLSSLSEVEGGLGFILGFYEGIALPNLTSVGSIQFLNNSKLDNVSLPMLGKASQDIAANANVNLKELSFPNVTTVGGAVDLAGNFTNVTFPKLTKVTGKFNLQSSENITDACNYFQSIKGNGKPLDQVTCAGLQDTPQGLDGKPTNSNGESAATKIGMSAFIGLTGMAMYAFL